MRAYLGNSQIEIWRQGDHIDGNIVDFGTNFVHAVSGRCGQDFILSGLAKDAHQKIDGLVGTNTDEKICRGQSVPAVFGVELLQRNLVRVGVTFQGIGVVVRVKVLRLKGCGAEGIFVRIQENTVGIIIAGASVRLQFQDVFPGNLGRNTREWIGLFFFSHVGNRGK